ncbi:MAG: Wzt carbohydrate-binding domain-containing protein, partial [Crocosphaera sp.]
AVLHSVLLESNGKKGIDTIKYLDELILHLDLSVDANIKSFNIALIIISQELQNVAMCSSAFNQVTLENLGEHTHVTVNLGKMNLGAGCYSLTISVFESSSTHGHGEFLCRHSNCYKFRAVSDMFASAPMQLLGEWSVSAPYSLSSDR